MIWKQLKHTLRKPQVILKVMVISVLFFMGVWEQLDLLEGFSANLNGVGQMTVGTFLIHTFNYFDFYMNLLFIGLIMLVPDFAQEEYLPFHFTMLNGSRFRAGCVHLCKMMVYMFFYLMWFALLALFISGIRLHNFSLDWPQFFGRMYKDADFAASMGLIMLPQDALNYPMPLVLFLVLLRSYLGFLVLAWLASLVILMTGKSGYGIGNLLLLLSFMQFLYFTTSGGYFTYYANDADPMLREHIVNLMPYTVFYFFSFRSLNDNVARVLRFAFLDEAVWLLVLGAGILLFYKKGDFADADRNA